MKSESAATEEKEWPEKKSAFKSPWVLGWIAMVIVIITANMTMVVIASKTSSGLVVEDYYEKGKNYQKSIEKLAREKALGWKASLVVPGNAAVNSLSTFVLNAKDSTGAPLLAEEVTIHAFRPSDAEADFQIPMTSEGGGDYSGKITFLLPGHWDIVVSLKRGNDEFEVVERIFVKKAPSA
ncbi:MAG: FixH family protein [Deltaproteobacteria bacterium]|nr:FixH family protein [Deltaproteobacteria bacterium]